MLLRMLPLGTIERLDSSLIKGAVLQCEAHGGRMGVPLSPGSLGWGQRAEVAVKVCLPDSHYSASSLCETLSPV